MSKLVIVESPTKARTIRNFLSDEYDVLASMGHVRDLPPKASAIPADYKKLKWAKLGVNVRENFEPLYVIPEDKESVVKELKQALKQADELILATDEDREGESISWHLQQVLKPKVPTKRMVFHEITQDAIRTALQNCRDIDQELVRAQETRRILDRLVGYTLSPLLWSKMSMRKLSAGRVQSVAVKLLVDRERQRRAFRRGTYWDLKATLIKDETPFTAELTTLGDKRLASGQDFDESTGQIAAGRDVVLLNETQAHALRDRLRTQPWVIASVEDKPSTRKPSPPFTTSTLQQEANRKLRLSAQQTMRIAQKLYEEGYITYMRTDSVHLSEQAIAAARSCVESMYGANYLSPKPRTYTTKSKAAQEAHEAIRPAGSEFRLPADTPLQGQDLALYDLIWKRTVACQMADARLLTISIGIQVAEAGFRASGKRIEFPGFFRAYVEGSDDPEAALENKEVHLPTLAVGDEPTCSDLQSVHHETQPPPRFTEASLVKLMESEGIGRPSTYAATINTIVNRTYARQQGNALIPSYIAFAVIELLEQHFHDLVDTHFTARMEETLDDIATGKVNWLLYLSDFYLGDDGLEKQVQLRNDEIDPIVARSIHLDGIEFEIRVNQYGAYVEITDEDTQEVQRVNIRDDIPPADLTHEDVEKLVQQKLEGPSVLTYHPDSGVPVYVLHGPFGHYVQLGDSTEENPKPKRQSLPKTISPDTITPEQALGLLSLPRTLGNHPETSKPVIAHRGRFGPYVECDGDYRSIPASDDVLTISLARALDLLAQPKKGRGKRSSTPIREIGPHPADGELINIYDGPYGHYVKHGKVNATIPKDMEIETLTLEQALTLIANKSQKKTTKTGSTKTASKGTTAKNTTSKTAAKSKTSSQTKTTKTSTKGKTTKAKSTTKATTPAKPAAKSKSTVQPEAPPNRSTSKTSIVSIGPAKKGH